MVKIYQCFPKAITPHDETPDKYRRPAPCEVDPKRITWENNLILAKTRGFVVNRGPPGHLPQQTREVENSRKWGILATMFYQIGKSGKTSGKTFWPAPNKNQL